RSSFRTKGSPPVFKANNEASTVEADSITQQSEQTADQTDNADLVVGVLAELDPSATAMMCDGLRALPAELRIAVLHDGQQEKAPLVKIETRHCASVFFVPSLLAKPSARAPGVQSMSETYQSVFAAAEKLQARACCIIASKLEAMTLPWY